MNSFYIPSNKQSPQQSKTEITKTMYLPRIKETSGVSENSDNKAIIMNASSVSHQSPTHIMKSVGSATLVSSQSAFDNLFYKRLQHIERVLDEDPLELERFKSYYNSITASVKKVKPLTNLLINKDTYNASKDNIGPKTSRD